MTDKRHVLNEGDMTISSAIRREFCISPAAGTPPSALTKPDFWKHVARHFIDSTQREWKMPVKVEVMPKDGKWWGEFLILFADRHHAKAVQIRHIDLDDIEEIPQERAYFVQWISPSVRFCVIRRSDNERVISGCETKEIAMREMASLEGRMAA